MEYHGAQVGSDFLVICHRRIFAAGWPAVELETPQDGWWINDKRYAMPRNLRTNIGRDYLSGQKMMEPETLFTDGRLIVLRGEIHAAKTMAIKSPMIHAKTLHFFCIDLVPVVRDGKPIPTIHDLVKEYCRF